MVNFKKFFIKKDFFIILFILSICVLGLLYFKLNSGNSKIAVIEQDKNIIKKINLSKVSAPYEIYIDAKYPATILVEHGKISIKGASCPDKVCENTGKISDFGEIIVCLPSKLIIKIENPNKSIDATTF